MTNFEVLKTAFAAINQFTQVVHILQATLEEQEKTINSMRADWEAGTNVPNTEKRLRTQLTKALAENESLRLKIRGLHKFAEAYDELKQEANGEDRGQGAQGQGGS